jgi:phosphate-selective porin OprO/OprP
VDFTGRVTYAPILEPTQVLHFGVGVIYRNPSDSEVRFRQRPDSHVTGVRYVDTSAISDVKDIVFVDPEIFYMYGPFAAQAEYTWVNIERASTDIDLRGWYAQLSYFLTGDNKGYDKKKAKLDRTKVLKDLGKDGGIGAWEVAVRLDNLDFDDGSALQKGTEQNWTVGLNWYPNPYFRFSANYVWVNNNNTALGNAALPLAGVTFTGDDDPQIFQIRAQVDW